jgi:hypothetical protein
MSPTYRGGQNYTSLFYEKKNQLDQEKVDLFEI